MRIRWTDEARQDRRELITHVEQESPLVAFELDERISHSTSRLDDYPHSGRPGRVTGTRELVVGRSPYIVVYVVGDAEVTIVSVIHGAQDWPPRDLI